MGAKVKAALLLIGSITLAGCDSVTYLLEAQETLATLDQQVATLEQDLAATKAELDEIKRKQASLELSNLFRDLERVAHLRPGDSGYSLVRFDLGTLTVQLADVKPYANGSKLTLMFGNPLSSSINGLKAKLEWGRVDEKGIADNTSAKSKEITFTETLRPGAWTSASAVLDSTPPTELGFVRVREVEHTGISLSK